MVFNLVVVLLTLFFLLILLFTCGQNVNLTLNFQEIYYPFYGQAYKHFYKCSTDF